MDTDPTVSGEDVRPTDPVDRTPATRPDLGWTELAVATVAYLLLTIGGVLLAMVALGGAVPPTVPTLAIVGFATLGAVAIALVVRVRSLAAVGLRRTTWRWLLVGLGAGVGVWLLNRFVVLAYIALTGDESNPQADLADAAAGPVPGLVGVLLAGALLVPVAEELLFRGIGYGALRRHGAVLAAVVSAVLFGLAHGINVVLFGTIVLGLVAAVLYERSRSIWPAIVAHGVNNAIVFGTVAILL